MAPAEDDDRARPSILRRWPVVWAALAYLAVGTVALWPSIRPGRTLVAADILVLHPPYSNLPGRPPIHNVLLSDTPFQFYPWLTFVGDALRDGRLPGWNPTLLGGLPVTPNGFVNVYYPPTWLAAVLSPFDAYNAMVLLHLVLGALGVFVFARLLGARPLAAWVGGLFVFTADFWIHWSTHLLHIAGMAWLPWALAATTAVVERPSARRAAALAAVFGLWWTGANPQYSYYGTLTMGAWAVALLVHRRLVRHDRIVPAAAALAAGVVLGVALAAATLVPTVTRSQEIVREREVAASDNHMPKRQAIRLLVPDAYGNARDGVYFRSEIELEMDSPFVGIAALLLAIAAVGSPERRAWILLAGTGALLVVAFTGLPHRLFFAVVPGYDRFRVNARWLSVLPALVAPLAAVGLDRLLDRGRIARRALLVAGGLSLVAVVVWFTLVRRLDGAPEDYFWRRGAAAVVVVAVVVVAGLLASRRPREALAVLAVVVALEMGQVAREWYPSVVERGAFPPVAVAAVAQERDGRMVRVAGERTQFPPYGPNLPMVSGGTDSQGQTVLFPRDYDRFLRLVDDYGELTQAVNTAPPLTDPALLSSPLLDVLDVRTVVAGPDVAVPDRYPVIDAGDPRVYARPSLGPAVVVPVARPTTEEGMWRQVAEPGWDPAATAAVVGLRRPVTGAPGTVSGPTSVRPEAEVWEVDAPAGGFLRVSGNWDEGWSARVDGRRQPVLRADGVFRGVVLEPGRHRVEFSYDNLDEVMGKRVALLALVVVVALAVPWRRPAFALRSGAGQTPLMASDQHGGIPREPCLSVVMPCYNEVDTLAGAIERVLQSPFPREVIVVDDGSTDGSLEIADKIDDDRVVVVALELNRGKGAALREGFARATSPFVVIQDADFEYDPADYEDLLRPLLDGRADVVYGSRFMGGEPHRVLHFWHSVGNKALTILSNVMTDLNLTDMETGYKAFRREVIQSITLEEDRFGFEPEVTAKIARARWRVYEVGISYSGRTYAQGKKIGWKDGVRALVCILKYSPPGYRVRRLLGAPSPGA